tara:strand:- start:7292 stop:7492 length:201 start_codon:yes stop_codon:yes gene_type:complete
MFGTPFIKQEIARIGSKQPCTKYATPTTTSNQQSAISNIFNNPICETDNRSFEPISKGISQYFSLF